jgi:5-methylcytosine-specific restriction endonuclease McrA
MSDCTHQNTPERRRKKSTGAVVIAPQCQVCGKAMPEVSKDGRILAKLEWFDESIAERWEAQQKKEWEDRQKQWAENYRNHTGEWWDRYKEYLQSDQWKQVRRAVLERDLLCQKCFISPATQAHHLTYETFTKRGFSYPAECVGLCPRCHDEETAASAAAMNKAQ